MCIGKKGTTNHGACKRTELVQTAKVRNVRNQRTTGPRHEQRIDNVACLVWINWDSVKGDRRVETQTLDAPVSDWKSKEFGLGLSSMILPLAGVVLHFNRTRGGIVTDGLSPTPIAYLLEGGGRRDFDSGVTVQCLFAAD